MKTNSKNNNQQPEASYATYLPYVLLVCCFFVYCNSIGHGFVLDDEAVITKNLFVKNGFAGFGDIFTTFYWRGYWDLNSGLYRPLSLIVFAIEWTLFPDKPGFFHFVQVALYTVTVLALYNMLKRVLEGTNKWLPFGIALLFALHPLHTEVVANIKSLDEVLALLFFILSTNWLIKKDGYSWQGCVFFFLALLSKEGAIAFIPVWFLLLVQIRKQNASHAFKAILPLVLTAGLWLLIRTLVINSGSPVVGYTYADNSLLACSDWISQKMTAITVLGMGLLHVLYPAGLSYDYSYPQIPCATFASTGFWAALVVLCALLAVAIYYFKRKPVVSFGILFFFATSFLTSNLLFPIGATMADRFMFVPILGLFLAICYVGFELTHDMHTRKAGTAAVAILGIALVFGMITRSNNTDWKSNDTLFASHAKKVPHSARAQYNYGTVLLTHSLNHNNDSLNRAFEALSLAHTLDPKNMDAISNLGIANYHLQNYDVAGRLLKEALLAKKNDDQIRLNLADTYVKLKQIDNAVALYKEALQNNQYNENSHGRIGGSFFAAKQFGEAAAMFKLGTIAYPDNAELWMNYGNALAAGSNYKEAIPAFEQALQRNPSQRMVLYYLALTYHNMGNDNKANAYMQRYQTGG
ncbi:tetratricopeptide repeat protein [Flavobacterium humi]|uniref:Tetratricopeptide repeat protein n=1 Tax=Flavobacterium humi TaxID=2562683 RepID=A0A4Z0L767_9FLAO|nr:tetratricopeptide repeat protein [Flavobacterium humi]TGD57862.1 tetratricopeptide repeat protein [Flavobacterium humi]